MSEEKRITCSHCRSEIPHGASVCRGCQAEINYGTPGFIMLLAFLLPVGAGLYIAKFFVTSQGFSESAGFIIWGATTIAGLYGAVKLCRACFGNYVSFIRKKNQ